MGRLAGFSADEVIRKLKRAGFVFDRQAKGSHEIWWRTLWPEKEPQSRIILETCLKVRFEPLSSKPRFPPKIF